MKLNSFSIVAAAVVFVAASVSMAAQETEPAPAPAEPSGPAPIEIYSLGQQSIMMSAGLFIPLFYQSFSGAVESTNLSLGVSGSLAWGIHLDNHFMIGAEVAGSWARSPLENSLLMLPIVLKGSYIFHLFPIEIPVSLGLGMNLIKYQTQSHIDLILKPGVSPMWKYSSSWSFGLNIAYWWIFQFATGDQDPSQARMGHFLSITPVAQYNF